MSADVQTYDPSLAEKGGWPITRRLFSPFSVLIYVYVAYFALTYSRIYEYVYWELMNLGTRIIGFHPTPQTLLLYSYGLVVLVFTAFVERVPLVKRMGVGFSVSLLGWAFGFAANVLQVVASGGISLTNISSRWAQSPVLVLLAATQILFVPALVVNAKGPWKRSLAALLFIVSILGLGLLGARNLPAKLVVSGFLAVVYVVKPRNIWRMAAVFLVLGVLAMGIVGSISKSGIYGPSATAQLALALTYSDSVGTAYNLDRIVNLTPSTGTYGGQLLGDSVLATIPGIDADYANYQLGSYLGGRSYFMIGEEVIERSVSLAPTLLGAPYADWGVPGVVGQMLLLGGIFGYLQRRSRTVWWFIPVLVTMASYVINGVNAGVHNPHALLFVGAALLLTIADVTVGLARGRVRVRPRMG
jgi:hypothetical protein